MWFPGFNAVQIKCLISETGALELDPKAQAAISCGAVSVTVSQERNALELM